MKLKMKIISNIVVNKLPECCSLCRFCGKDPYNYQCFIDDKRIKYLSKRLSSCKLVAVGSDFSDHPHYFITLHFNKLRKYLSEHLITDAQFKAIHEFFRNTVEKN